jgi:hypothetical protein
MKKTKPQRGTSAPSEEYYAARGYGRLSLRMPATTLADLGRLAKKRGMSRTEIVGHLISSVATSEDFEAWCARLGRTK